MSGSERVKIEADTEAFEISLLKAALSAVRLSNHALRRRCDMLAARVEDLECQLAEEREL